MKTIQSKFIFTFIVLAMIVTAFFVSLIFENARPALGSTIQGNDYQATTTAASSVYGSFTGSRLVKTGQGSYGGLIITGANTGIINVYDATTTDISKRTNNTSTSSILIASYPASLAAGDYTGNDTQLVSGLYIELVSGNMPTTTVKFR